MADADPQAPSSSGGLLLFGGRIAYYVGRKRAFLIGLGIASAIGGIAQNQGELSPHVPCRADSPS